MTIVILVGMPGSGKEVFVEIAMRLGFSVVRMGDVVRKHALNCGLDMGDVSVGSHANSEREKEGADVWAKRTVEVLPENDVIIDGSRSIHELAFFKRHLEQMIIVGIDAPIQTRFERLLARGREDDPKSKEDFDRREERESGWGISDAMGSADITIINDSSLDAFGSKCENILGNIGEK